MSFYVYIIHSVGSDKYYIGQTTDLQGRFQRHNAATEPSTAPYVPWILVWHTEKASRSEAMSLENKLKNLSRVRLQRFIMKYGFEKGGS